MSVFDVFVYGTLKRGFGNHQRFCQGYTSLEPALVLGRLYDIGLGFPMMEVPEESILTRGHRDALGDTQNLKSMRDRNLPKPLAGDSWDLVPGEMLRFEDLRRYATLDRLEGFRDSYGDLYNRVMVPVYLLRKDVTVPGWCYVAPKGKLKGYPSRRRIMGWTI